MNIDEKIQLAEEKTRVLWANVKTQEDEMAPFKARYDEAVSAWCEAQEHEKMLKLMKEMEASNE